MDSKALSLVMAKRLKELRIGKGQEGKPGLSHSKLGEELSKKYGDGETPIISKDSLQNYEVSDPIHSKAYTNNGMKVEYLRFFADFYGVSADYLLGFSDVPTVNETLRDIHEHTGLSVDAIAALSVNRTIDDMKIAHFISFLVTSKELEKLIDAISMKNRFTKCPKMGLFGTEQDALELDASAAYKTHAESIFWEIMSNFEEEERANNGKHPGA